jgi:hypothetical protein
MRHRKLIAILLLRKVVLFVLFCHIEIPPTHGAFGSVLGATCKAQGVRVPCGDSIRFSLTMQELLNFQ